MKINYKLEEHKLDLSIFYSRYNNDNSGRPAYNPAIFLKIILFAYSKVISSSREIQWCCQNNLIFKALACDSEPHFTTIADFISHKPQDIEILFEQTLLICYQQGLLGHELAVKCTLMQEKPSQAPLKNSAKNATNSNE